MSWKRPVLYEASIRELCDIIGGNPAPKDEHFTANESGLPFVRMKDLGAYHLTNNLIKVSGNLKQDFLQKSRYKIIKKGSLLLPRSGSVALNHRAILGMDACIVSHICALEVKRPEEIFNKYLYYYLTTLDMTRISKKTTGLDAITFEDLGKIRIKYPPLPIQQKIAAILDQADALRKKDQQLLAKYDELLQAVFIDRFSFIDKTVKLSSVCKLINDGVHFKPNYTDNGIPFISVKNITNFYLDFDECKYVSKDDHEIMKKRCFPQKGDILYTKVGATYGRAAIVDTDEEFSLYVSVCLIKPDTNLVRPNFLRMLLNSPIIKRQADKSIKGAGVPDLHLVEIRNFSIPLPCIEEQKKFETIAIKLEELIMLQRREILQSENLFKSMLHQAFNGELVKE